MDLFSYIRPKENTNTSRKRSRLFFISSLFLTASLYAVTFPNEYSCGLFSTPLASYEHIENNGKNANVCNNLNLAYPKDQLSGDGDFTCSADGCGVDICTRQDPPTNRYVVDFPVNPEEGHTENPAPNPLTDYAYGNMELRKTDSPYIFAPTATYSDNPSVNVMMLGEVEMDSGGVQMSFEPGDYYFDSLTIDKNSNSIVLPNGGPVRLFIKGDLGVDMNNFSVNAGGSPDDLFIYVGGNFDSLSNGGGTTSFSAYIYVKGTTLLNNNSDNWVIEGGITSEGRVTIEGNNPSFVQSGDADALGLGSCAICYSDVRINDVTMDIDNCSDFTGKSPLRVPMYTPAALSNLTIDEVHLTYDEVHKTNYTFTIASRSGDKVVDHHDNFISNAVLDYSWSDGAIAMDLSDYNTNAVTYDFGSSYGPADETSYYTPYSSPAISTPCNWLATLAYVAHYTDDEGRHYSIKLDQCAGPGGGVDHNYSEPPFDAWDTFRGDTDGDNLLNDFNISTKLTDTQFNLIMGSLNTGRTQPETKPGISAFYRLYNNATDTSIGSFYELNASQTAIKTQAYIESEAYKNLSVVFRFCSDYNGTVFTLHPATECQGNLNILGTNDLNQVGWRETLSSDNFAIRPAIYDINISDGTQLTAESNVSVRFKALTQKYGTSATPNYNETEGTSFNVGLTIQGTGLTCQYMTGDNSPNVIFTDGLFESNIRFNNVGTYTLKIDEDSMPCASRFASVDCNDADIADHFVKDSNLSIGEWNTTVSIVPGSFSIAGSYDQSGDNFTYLSNLTESTDIYWDYNLTITALKGDGSIAPNYSASCYAKDFNLTFTKSVPPNGLTIQYVRLDNGSLSVWSDDNLTFKAADFNGTPSGTANIEVGINFDRSSAVPINPFTYTISAITYTDINNSISTSLTINQSSTFLYGRAHASRIKTSNTNFTIPVEFEIFYDTNASLDSNATLTAYSNGLLRSPDSIYWYRNTSHQATDGKVINGIELVNDVLGIDTSNGVTNGVQEIPVSYGGDSYPYRATVLLTTEPWLFYFPYADGSSAAATIRVPVEINNPSPQTVTNALGNDESNQTTTPNRPRRIQW